MSASQETSTPGVLGWPTRAGGAVNDNSPRIGRHRLEVRAPLRWRRMFYVARHRR